MKLVIHFVGFLTFVIIGTSCEQAVRKPENKAVPVERMMQKSENQIRIDPSVLVSDKDTICGMSLRNGIADTLHYQDKIYGFCSPGCKATFQKQIAVK
ncbi:MAG: YHS domain-containing protein [Bacteroidetes bacterium]|nr:YHS domain-containing protein [Bacteroidota bacterium]